MPPVTELERDRCSGTTLLYGCRATTWLRGDRGVLPSKVWHGGGGPAGRGQFGNSYEIIL